MIATVRCAHRGSVNTRAAAARRTANGEESRQKILAAATAIAGERGYDGTSIALVSERSGLPASSIYWHFKDKDALLAAVIERSWVQWVAGMSTSVQIEERRVAHRGDARTAAADRPGAARVAGLPAAGSHAHARAPTGRARRPHRVPADARARPSIRWSRSYAEHFADLDEAGARELATFTMAMADGLFVAREIRGDAMDLVQHFETLAVAVLAVADDLAARAATRTRV